MASSTNEALLQILQQLEALLPNCVDSDGIAPCIEEATSGRGFAVFNREDDRVCDSAILLPGFNLLPQWLLAATYLLFLFYLFAGVAIASDLFMEGIMQITATTRKVKRKNSAGEIVIVEEPVWNWVVANITLMALGTSSPEIMLATVEALLTLNKPAGDLGPSCIAGSAAYNFLVITAVCTTCIPDGKFKRISQLRVYVVTAAWSLWAYVWMLVVYVWWTPDEVTLTEAFLTLAFFVLMVLNAWIVDKQPWKKTKVLPSPSTSSTAKDLEEAAAATAGGNGELTPAELLSSDTPVKTHAHYRYILAARQRNTQKKAHHHPTELEAEASVVEQDMGTLLPADPTREQVMFRSQAYSFLESVGVAKVAVTRTPAEGGSLDKPLRVYFKTEDGDAVAGLDYVAREGSIYFSPGEKSKYIEVKIIDDDMCEPDVWFSVVLLSAESPDGPSNVMIAQDRVRVTIVDDDDAGVIGFELPEYEISFNEKKSFAEVTVVRRRGADGRIQVEYESQDLTAVSGEDYVGVMGTVVFESGEKSQRIRVDLLPGIVPETHKALRLLLKNPEGGAELGKRSSCKVTLVHRQSTFSKLEAADDMKGNMALKALPNGSLRAASDGSPDAEAFNLWAEWREQAISAFAPAEADEGETVGWVSLIMHYINITWKVMLFAVVPPGRWRGGYPCFLAALISIIGIVYLVNEAGNLFGCIIHLKEVMVGVSIVAFGTSLPDTLASRIAAINDPDADAAIGNITGSNAVNVFLGLGLPWSICSVYYKAKGETYVTPGGDLEFAILLYAVFGCLGVIILAVARWHGGELGGSKRRQYAIAALLLTLWVLYLILSGLRAYNNI